MKDLVCIYRMLLPFAVSWATWYLVGAFLGVNWNPEYWTFDLRATMVIFGTLYGMAMYLKLEVQA